MISERESLLQEQRALTIDLLKQHQTMIRLLKERIETLEAAVEELRTAQK